MTTKRIALVSGAADTRRALAEYLTNAGFDVHECDELAVPSAFTALVLIGGRDDSGDALAGLVRSWMRVAKLQRVVVVTPKPKALTGLVASYGERLRVLPAPTFGWDLVDALRSSTPPRPKGA